MCGRIFIAITEDANDTQTFLCSTDDSLSLRLDDHRAGAR